MYQMCKHGAQDGEPCEECAKIVALENAARNKDKKCSACKGTGEHWKWGVLIGWCKSCGGSGENKIKKKGV